LVHLLRGAREAVERFPLFEVRPSLTGRSKGITEEQMFDECGASQSQHAVDHDAAREHEPSAGAAIENVVQHHLLLLTDDRGRRPSQASRDRGVSTRLCK
jgi:hypothetical protein